MGLEIIDGREERIGPVPVRRVLPTRARRTVGAWCFADHMGPVRVTESHGLDIGPHPHIGLQTVTWLTAGEVLHRDSLGSEQLIAPGQLNLMTAGHGVAHSEEATGSYGGTVEGIQLWIAQPDATRHGPPAFEHHAALPEFERDHATGTVLVGEFDGVASPARHDTPLLGIDLVLDGPTVLAVRSDFEHAVVALSDTVGIDERALTPGRLAYLAPGRDELRLDTAAPTRVMILGGTPFDAVPVMWWNFVARSREEIDAADRSWRADDGRFGRVASPLPRIGTDAPWWQRER